MSSELSKECDKLLSTTSILSHNYGIPRVNATQRVGNEDDELVALEAEYVSLQTQLTAKTNKLLYLNRLSELQNESNQYIEDKYRHAQESCPLIEPDQLEQFLKLYGQNVKTQAFLNESLQTTLPILRAIHQSDTDLTTSEIKLLQNLETLFKPGEGISYQAMKQFNNSQEALLKYAEKTHELSRLVQDDLKPELLTLKDLNSQLQHKSADLIRQKHQRLQNELDTRSTKDKKQIQKKFTDLVTRWNFLTRLCEFLPILISSLPVNWYNDKDLLNIIQECETISEKLAKYQSVINNDTIDNFTLEDLLMLDFSELE